MPVTGLFLHRIATEHLDNGWSMSADTFEELLDWLEENVDLVSIDEAQQRIKVGNNKRIAVNISFDDGYADNCVHAIPSLLRRKIPFTYYVTTYNVKHGKPFPHDLKLGQPLSPNSIPEVQAMAEAGVEIGVHTRTHADVGNIRHLTELEHEIKGARHDLASWIGYEPAHFAFPYGKHHNMSPRSIQFLHDEGFRSYCSAYGGYNFPGDGSFHLKRFHGDPILSRIKNWLTLDPRWVYARPEYEYIPFQRQRKRIRTRPSTANG